MLIISHLYLQIITSASESRFWNIVMLKEKPNTLAIVDNQLKTIEQNVNAAVNAGVANRNDLLQVNPNRSLEILPYIMFR